MSENHASLTLTGGTGIVWDLAPGVSSEIGSGSECTIKLPPVEVAPKHCAVFWDGSRATVSEICDEFETRLNGSAISSSKELRDGDVIEVGAFKFRFARAGATSAALPVSSDTSEARSAAVEPVEESHPLPAAGEPRPLREVRIADGLTIGSAETCDVRLRGDRIASLHATIQSIDGDPYAFEIVDHSGRDDGCRVNSDLIDQCALVYGDRIELGSTYHFVYDGYALLAADDFAGCEVTASQISVSGRGGFPILDGAGIAVRSGDFAGILGPSGSGKTTLIKSLIGIVRLGSGSVNFGGEAMRYGARSRLPIGYVPQFDTIQESLTARQALRYCALLRLPARTRRSEITRYIARLAEQFQLDTHLDKRISTLSGGQRKRLCICVELLTQPEVLFLDEPNSGLDPRNDYELFKHLQKLCVSGRTVICTTHLMENVQLMDHIEVLAAAGEGGAGKGCNVFRGRPSEAREFFELGPKGLPELFLKLDDRSVEEWAETYRDKMGGELEVQEPPRRAVENKEMRGRYPRRRSFPILLERQLVMLLSDLRALSLFAFQALFLGLLIALTAGGTESVSATSLFLSHIAVLWLGCGNVATVIVRERRVFLRERFHGLSCSAYLLSKFCVYGTLAVLQAVFVFSIVWGTGLPNLWVLQLGCLVAIAMAGTAIGLLISCWARTEIRAVFAVPLFLVPQILLSGFVIPIKEWDSSLLPRIGSRAMPSFACQRIMDSTFLWGIPLKEIDPAYTDTREERSRLAALANLETTARPGSSLLSPETSVARYRIDESQVFSDRHADPPGQAAAKIRELRWDGDDAEIRAFIQGKEAQPPYFDPQFVEQLNGEDDSFRLAMTRPILTGFFSLILWILIPLAVASAFLRRERES